MTTRFYRYDTCAFEAGARPLIVRRRRRDATRYCLPQAATWCHAIGSRRAELRFYADVYAMIDGFFLSARRAARSRCRPRSTTHDIYAFEARRNRRRCLYQREVERCRADDALIYATRTMLSACCLQAVSRGAHARRAFAWRAGATRSALTSVAADCH